jgi:putative PIN family toxin of toxin-antitoxin system
VKLVLDTNVVLDWLAFEDDLLRPLEERIADGRVTIVTHVQATSELRRVLRYPALKFDEARRRAVMRRYRATVLQMSAPQPPAGLVLPERFPVCRDPDDNHFLALAYHARADALVSKDKAVLALRKRVRAFGFRILDVREMIAAIAVLATESGKRPQQ